MRRAILFAIGFALWGAVSFAPAYAQSADASDLRQRLEDQRTSDRRTVGERSLERTNTELEQRRRLLIRRQTGTVGSARSIPIPPKSNSSSVVVNQ